MPQIKMLEKHHTHFVVERNGQRIAYPRLGDLDFPVLEVIQTLLEKTEVGQIVEGFEF